MRPCTLRRATSSFIARHFVNKAECLDITVEEDRRLLVGMLAWIGQEWCVSLCVVQAQLHNALTDKLKDKVNSPVYLTCMLALCPHVIVDQIKFCMGPGASRREIIKSGHDISEEESCSIMAVIDAFQERMLAPEAGEARGEEDTESENGSGGSKEVTGEEAEEGEAGGGGNAGVLGEAGGGAVVKEESGSLVEVSEESQAQTSAQNEKVEARKEKDVGLEAGSGGLKEAGEGGAEAKEDIPDIMEVSEKIRTHTLAPERWEAREEKDTESENGSGAGGAVGGEAGEVNGETVLGSENGIREEREAGGKTVTGPPPLRTKSLVLEAVSFRDPEFLPRLVERMPYLQHVSLQCNISVRVMQTLSQHCRQLEALCFLEFWLRRPFISIDQILAFLFGVPSHLVTADILQRMLAEKKSFLKYFVPQFPNLKRLDIKELLVTQDNRRVVAVLVLLLQPKLKYLDIILCLEDLLTVRHLWEAVHKPNTPVVLPLRIVSIDATLKTFLVIPFNVMRIVGNLASVRPFFYGDDRWITFIQLFSYCSISAFSVKWNADLPERSFLKRLRHLQLTAGTHALNSYVVHVFLDNCPDLCTLSIYPEIIIMQWEEYSLPSPPLPHSRLTSLQICSEFIGNHKQIEIFLHDVFCRVPRLQRLCLGPWLDVRMRESKCHLEASQLYAVITKASLIGIPLLSSLQQLCWQPMQYRDGERLDGESTCQSLVALVDSLPALRYLVLPPSRTPD